MRESDPDRLEPHALPVVAILSASLLALEIGWTRLFSAEFFYNFAFLILSLAILGLGLGALTLRLFPALGRPERLGPLLLLTGIAAAGAPLLVFRINPDLSLIFGDAAMLRKFVATILLLGSAFFTGGMALAHVMKRNHPWISRVYMADLIGAGIGVPIFIALMNRIGTPAATFSCALPVLAAAVFVSRGWLRILPAAAAVGAAFLVTAPGTLLEKTREERAPVIYRHWDATAKVKIYDYGEGYRGINIDNAANSPVYEFDGNWDRPDSLRFQFGIDVGFLIDRFDSCTFLSLGAGGGTDVLQALQAGCPNVHAVEVVPHVNEMMLTGELADYTGHFYQDPRVTVITDDARSYVRHHPNEFDLIYSLSSNTFAALASGAFAMAENYLFTTDAFRDYWRALTANGFLSMEHQFYMPRLVAELMDALDAEGVEDPPAHFAVYALPEMRRQLLLLSKRPLTDEIRNFAYGELTPEIEEQIHLLYPPREGDEDNVIAKTVAGGWRSVAGESDIDLSPCTDDRPFTAQLGLWRNFRWDRLDRVSPLKEVGGFPLAKMIVVVTLLVVVLLVLPLNLLPLAFPGDVLRPVPWLYFFAIGMAFMMVEVVLIQQFTFFVGPAAYGVATILGTLLVASGIGSRFAERIDLRIPFGGILLWLLLDVVGFSAAIRALPPLGMGGRILVTALLVAPLGFCMGVPFARGAHRVGPLVDWAFAVNGAASVLGSCLILLVAFSAGFRVALLLAALVYLAAGLLLAREAAWRPGDVARAT